jgi:gliding motility-associated-like protein
MPYLYSDWHSIIYKKKKWQKLWLVNVKLILIYLQTNMNTNEKQFNSTWSTSLFVFAASMLFSFSLFAQTHYEAPKLVCVRNNASQIELTWQLPLTPNPCFEGYEIYTSIGNRNGPYSLDTTLTNAAQTTTLLTIASGGQTVFFYMINRGSCVNPTPPAAVTSDTLNNEKPQPYTVIINATVIGGQVQLNWVPAPSPEVSAYLVYNDRDGFTTPDTVFGRLNNTFTDTENNPDASAIRYKIRSLEFCEDPAGLQGAITPDTADHRTIFMQIASPDKCTQTANISWQPYKIGSAQVLNYEIERSINRGPFEQAGTVNATTTNFLLQNIPFRDTVCIRIKTNLPNGASAFSNERCFSADVIQRPVNDYIRNISVINGNILIDYKKDTAAAPPKTIILQRSNDGIIFTPIINIPTEPDTYTYLFSDDNLAVNNQTFTYRVNLVDSCFNTHSSDTATTLRIALRVKSNNKADVIWSGFDVQNITFSEYRLEKITGTDTVLLGTFDRSETTFLETELFDYSRDSLDGVCYRISAVFVNNNDAAPRETLTSFSNIVCKQPEPKAFVPQAFVPDGTNKTFKPFLLYSTAENYEFLIFDRWQQLVFSTNDVNASWDGSFKGKPAPLDSYLYIIKFKGKNNQDYTQTGMVMLLK